MTDRSSIPQHVAIIMDGNGRWAQQLGKERYEGHIAGVESVRASVRAAVRNGVKYLTLYAFSTENWGRPRQEVEAIMELFCRSVISEVEDLRRQGVRVMVIGRRNRFSERVREHLEAIERQTADGDKLTLVLAFDYSSRSEIAAGVQALARRVAAGELSADDIDEQAVADSLYTASIPDPDIIVRSGGECRLSNFLLWQASYAELYFPSVLWPDFGEEQFDAAVEEFARRDRRYGLVNDKKL
ncbi:MAG: di-trans,poly-cis-decaprenylcistransferase [Alistipes sp.]|nr:di-trans,poly-cis-decaprenylcistransferase [Alistipes sp.]MDE7129027.1 di-trans,poly-cis-decaprenylcistransferase [Alistipes sp.]